MLLAFRLKKVNIGIYPQGAFDLIMQIKLHKYHVVCHSAKKVCTSSVKEQYAALNDPKYSDISLCSTKSWDNYLGPGLPVKGEH